jgi:sulfite reductase alpha subunit-like flavoprotein
MHFAIFGLGDTSYEQFNEMGIQFNKTFEKLGGIRVFEMGVGNAEHHTTEDDFETWRAKLWPALIEFYSTTETPEQKQLAEKKKVSVLQMRKLQESAVLPWLCEDVKEGEEVKNEGTWDMNMRNYISSSELKVVKVE